MSIIRKEQLSNPLSASYALTASYAENTNIIIDTGSLLITASVESNIITFTKGNTDQFSITIDTGSVTTIDTSSLVTTSSFNAFTSSINQFTSSYNTGSFSGSFIGNLTGTADTASYYQETDPVFVAKSASLATTGSNVFVGNQIITGSLSQGLEGNITSGEYSHAEGSITKAIGDYSHAEGDSTQAIGFYSHAEGRETITLALGQYSHAEGYNTIASANYQHVQGQWNATSSAESAFIVGNGTDDSNRSNLIYAAGNEVQITGSLAVNTDITTPTLNIHQINPILGQDLYIQIPSGRTLDIWTDDNGGEIVINSTGVLLQTNGTANTWTFDKSGSLTAPGGVTAASFTGSLQGTAATASYYQETDPVFTAVSGTFVTTSSFNAFTSSIYSFTSSINQFTSSYNTGSFSGSFSGSFYGTASWAQSASQAISSSYAQTSSNILGGKATHIPLFITDTSLATSSIYQSGSATVIINQDNATSANPEALYVWQPNTSSFNVISGKGNLNNYLQLNIQNTNQGATASSDVVATANNGNESINYIDMGINNENYTQNFIGAANDAYLYSTGNDLHIGNATPNKALQFFAGGSDVDVYNKLQLTPDNQHLMSGSLDISGSLNVRNTLTSSGLLTNGNNNILGNTTMSGSSTIQGTTTMTGSLLVSGSTTQVGNNTLIGNTLLSGSITISGSSAPGSISASVQIYGDIRQSGYHRFDPVTTNIDTSVSASYIYVSGSTNDLYFSQNGSGYNNVTRLRWLEGNLYTGLLHGGLITTQSSTIYQISSGSGIIVNLNASIPNDPYPTIQYINWPNLSASIAPLSASFDQQFVAINSTSNITAQGVPYTNGQFNTLIPIGIVIHQNHTTINAVQTFPSTGYGWKQRSSDFIRAFGPLKISGYTLQSSSSRGLLLDGGTAFVDGRNYTVDPNNPSYIVEATGIATSKIYYYYQSGSDFKYDTNNGAGYTNITSSLYSLNGTLTPLSNNNRWSIQRVYYFPNSATKAFYIYYGNVEYTDYAAALAGLSTERFNEAPNTAANALFIGYMLLQKTANFTTPSGSAGTWEFRPAGMFRGSGAGTSGGSGGGGSSTLAGLTDVAISSPINGQPLVYNSTTTKWSNNSSITASLHGTASWAEYVVNSGGNAFPYTGSAIITGSLVITGSTTSTLGFTGSLFGTSSWAINASQSISSSFATSASYATTAQNLLGSVTSAATASHAVNFTIEQKLTLDETLTDFAKVNSTIVGSNNLFEQVTGSYTSAHGKYTLYNGANARAGEFVTVWNDTTVTYYDNATTDIGNTADITFSSAIVTSQIQINAIAASSGWTIKMLTTYL